MPRGEHDLLKVDPTWTDADIAEKIYKRIFCRELFEIMKRRRELREKIANRDPSVVNRMLGDRTKVPITGLALSGGGIRSASVCLGALQAIHRSVGIEGIDYLSTVSGGGYIGCCLTAAMHAGNGEFPFTRPDRADYGDTDSVRHIRDFQNYLFPHGKLDMIIALRVLT